MHDDALFNSLNLFQAKDDGGATAVDAQHAEPHRNGLVCWSCDGRLDLGSEVETDTVNAYHRCLNEGSLQYCKG